MSASVSAQETVTVDAPAVPLTEARRLASEAVGSSGPAGVQIAVALVSASAPLHTQHEIPHLLHRSPDSPKVAQHPYLAEAHVGLRTRLTMTRRRLRHWLDC